MTITNLENLLVQTTVIRKVCQFQVKTNFCAFPIYFNSKVDSFQTRRCQSLKFLELYLINYRIYVKFGMWRCLKI